MKVIDHNDFLEKKKPIDISNYLIYTMYWVEGWDFYVPVQGMDWWLGVKGDFLMIFDDFRGCCGVK